eukprot:2017938-Prorocentrum_lima.AAC.1
MNLRDQGPPLHPFELNQTIPMLRDPMKHGMPGNNASTQSYEPNRPGLELVVARRLTVLTPGRQQYPQEGC